VLPGICDAQNRKIPVDALQRAGVSGLCRENSAVQFFVSM